MDRIRRLARPLLVAWIMVATLGWVLAVPAATPVRAWDAGTFSSADENLLFTLTNQARAAAGLGPLRYDSQLHALAEWRAQDMSVRDYFSHEIPPLTPGVCPPPAPGDYVFCYMDRRGIRYVLAGENIGWDNAPDDQATTMVQTMFMNSPEHRSNILGSRWDSMGVGAYKGTDGVIKYAVLFKQSAPAPAATPTPRPTVRPTPQPTPTPTGTAAPIRAPGRTAPPTPRQTATPAPATPRQTATPAPATPAPTVTPSPIPEQTPTAAPTATPAPAATTPFVSPTVPVSPTPPAGGQGASQRIVDDAPAPGLLQSLVSGIFALLGSV